MASRSSTPGATFFVASVGGILLGVAIGAVTAWAVGRVNDPVFSVVLTFLAPLVAYLAASNPWVPLSGVLATVAAGIILGRNAPRLMSSEVRLSGVAGWQILLFLINGSVFILIGLQLPTILSGLGRYSPAELIGLARGRVRDHDHRPYRVGLPRHLSAAEAEREDPGARPRAAPTASPSLIGWAGMRGVVSLAAALALPIDFPDRNLLIFLTFAVILATLVGQGVTLPFLIERLGIDDGGGATDREEAYAQLMAADAATARLEQLAAQWPGHLELIDRLRAQYDDRTRHARIRKHPEERNEEAEQELIEHREIRVSVLEAEREAILTLRERGAISDEVYRVVERDLDLEELRMEV